MSDLNNAAHDKEGPEDPWPGSVLADKTSNNSTNWSATDRREDDKRDCVLEAGIFWLIEIGYYTKRD